MRLPVTWLLLLLAAWGLGPARAQAQGPLAGQVRDARTQRPLAYASVFLASTTYGTTTDSTGHFVLAGVPNGQYQLMASYVGYELFTKVLVLPQAAALTIGLKAAAVQLTEVVVQPAKNRPADFRRFTELFLGASALSRQCRIENPEEVVVFYDKSRQELTAAAPRTLRVLNPALGYRITYHNFDFKALYLRNQCVFVAAPVFEALKSADAKQQQRWEENRRRAYAGSLPHFLRSVRENRLAQEGFLAQVLRSEPNAEPAQRRVAAAGDSLAEAFVPEPGILSWVYKAPLSAEQIRRTDAGGQRVQLYLPFTLRVTYQGEQPDAVFAARVAVARRNAMLDAATSRRPGSKTEAAVGKMAYEPALEVSELRPLGPEALILPNGYLSNPLSVKVDGYWAFEKVGEALPLDYVPALLK